MKISDDTALLDLDVIHGYLTRCYWAEGIPREVVERSIAGSLCFGAYEDGAQVGFARVVTDQATFAYLADVFVLETYRGRGVSRQLMEAIVSHPQLQGLRRWHLVTRDAHGVYAKFGFKPLAAPERHMELTVANAYRKR
jgi:GNAT superfamily N-acetyltransferase